MHCQQILDELRVVIGLFIRGTRSLFPSSRSLLAGALDSCQALLDLFSTEFSYVNL